MITDLLPYLALWLGVAYAAYAVGHHIHHVIKGGHR